MSIFQPTAFYFGQPVAASAGFIIRPDTYASSVTVAIPGTQFGSTFGQTSFRSDISGYINGGSSLPELPLSGSGQTTNTATNFASVPYGTSMSRGSSSNLGAIAGNTSNVNFGTGDFTIECWMYMPTNVSGDNPWYFCEGSGVGFCQYSGGPRWTFQNAAGAETSFFPGTPTLAANTWHHFATCRVGSTWYSCLNGVIRGNNTLSGATGTNPPFQFMGWNGNGSQRTDYFQDFRITKGVARYTGAVNATYTMPSSIVTTG